MTSYLKQSSLLLLFSLAIIPAVQNAHATAISQATVSADWTTFTATLDGQSINFDYGQSSTSYGRAEYVDNTGIALSHSAPGWGITDAQSSIPNAMGHGYTSVTSMKADGTGIADGITNTYGRGVSYTYRIGYFSSLLNSDPNSTYELAASLVFDLAHFFSYDPLTDNVGAYNQYAIGLYYIDAAGITQPIAGDSRVFMQYSGSVYCNGGPDCNGYWTLADTLSINQALIGGRIYAIDAFLYTDANAGTPAVIPEPATLGLLALGLIGFAVSRHRKFV